MCQTPDRLTHGERLLIRAVRLLALHTPCHGLRAHFEAACGCAGVEAYRALEVFLQQLRRHGRRRLALSVPADPRLTGDEALVLAAFASAQAGDYRRLDRWLIVLLGAPPPAALGAAACLVADILGLNGLVLVAGEPQDGPVAIVGDPDRAIGGDGQAHRRAGRAAAGDGAPAGRQVTTLVAGLGPS